MLNPMVPVLLGVRRAMWGAPDGYTPEVCLYHDPCSDGFTAAWVIQARWPSCEMIPARYQAGALPDVAGKHVLLVDFSYKRDDLIQIAAEAASVTILDHHLSAQRDLEPLLASGMILGQFDMERSGAMMAWNFAYPDEAPPLLVQYVQDRDLWTWALPHAKEICSWLNLQPLNFEAWSKVAQELERKEEFQVAINIGAALVKKLDSDVASGIRATKRRMMIGGHDVPVANLPHFLASDAGNVLSRGEPFAATYFDTPDGSRSFSLRSDKDDPSAVDVSEIATYFGGGGHKNASGFRAPAGWEGDGTR